MRLNGDDTAKASLAATTATAPAKTPAAETGGTSTTTTSSTPETTISTRLDRLPYTRKHTKLIIGTGLGWALDAMDVGLISFILVALTKNWQITANQSSLLVSLGFAGMAIGAALGGTLADRYGRRQIFALTLLIYGLATGLSALAPNITVLLFLRFLIGFGLGAELPVASSYISEFAPKKIRGTLIVILEAFWAVGWLAAATIGYLIVPANTNGWRIALAVGAIPAAYALYVRWKLPESPRWLQLQGKTRQAAKIVDELENTARRAATTENTVTDNSRATQHPQKNPAANPTPNSTTPLGTTTRARLQTLFAKEFRLRTTAIWTVWFFVNASYYGAFIWIPSILFAQGFDIVKSFEFTLIITLAQLPGYAAAAWLIERIGRKLTLTIFLIGSAAGALLFGTSHSETAIIAAGMTLSFFNLGAWGTLYAITPELYPTSLRGAGAGWAAATGRIASIIIPLAMPALLTLGVTATFTVFAIFFAIAGAAAWGIKDYAGKALDDR